MLCFAAFTPHSPLLIDSVGRENKKQVLQTLHALQELSDELYASFPEVILVISSHNTIHTQAFSANLHDTYTISFQEFGDLSTHKTVKPDLELITAIQREARRQEIPFLLTSQETLDYGTGVPLLLLCQDRLHPSIVPVSYSGMDRKAHMAFGRLLQEVIKKSPKRIAVVASGDLAHCLNSDAPMGFRKEGEQFDQMVLHATQELSLSTLLSFDEAILEQAAECSFRPLLILFGLLERMNIRPEIRSYEFPFGVGYLVAQFHLKSPV